uniref:Uncharacterized protein n=1 Tax=Globodera pallida TaxID=36090 RepID=A0A183CTA3_GLOPA
MANIYNEFIIVEEKLITDIRRSGHHINSQFTDRTAFAALKFTMEYARYDFLKIENTAASHSTNASGPLAQIVLWKWDGGTQKIEETITLNRGGTVDIDYYTSPSIIIRILEKREVIEK